MKTKDWLIKECERISNRVRWTADKDGTLWPIGRFIGQYASEIAAAHNAAIEKATEWQVDEIVKLEDQIHELNRRAAHASEQPKGNLLP